MIQREGLWWPDGTTTSQVQHALKHVQSIEWAIARCKQRRTAVQAGGNIGLWPRRLAQSFENVITFEPDAISIECLRQNVPDNVDIQTVVTGTTSVTVTGSCTAWS